MDDIDLVYLWVDGNDPVWRAKRDAFIGVPDSRSDANNQGRFADNDELKYSLRSVEKYAPWIRRIFIITDNQVPAWLDTSNPRVRIVDHTEILPPEALPCFNSQTIEHRLHLIPGLAEKFLLSNDDMLLNRPMRPEDFFAADGLPYQRMLRRPLKRLWLYVSQKILHLKTSDHVVNLQNATELIYRRYGVYYNLKPHHNIDAYLRSNNARAYAAFADVIEPTLANHLRSLDDIQRLLYSLEALAVGKAHLKVVDERSSFYFDIHKPAHYRKFERLQPPFFCVNDSKHATEADRHALTAFLKRLFPEPSQFEKAAGGDLTQTHS